MRLSLAFLASVFAGCAAVATAAAETTFVDRFERVDPGRWIVSDGWTNGDWQVNDWRRGQIAVGPAGLTVSLDRNPASKNGYSSGEFQSRGLFTYGYYEARIRAAASSGVVTGFFTYIGPPQGRPWNEIDVEILGKNTKAVSLTYHVGKDQHGTVVNLPFDTSLDAHTFGFDWQPQYIRWYVDGKLVHEDDGTGLPLPTEPQKIYFDLWGSNSIPDWTGKFSWHGHPIIAQVRCIATAPSFSGVSLC